MNEWHNICITDKTGKQFFKCTASPMSTSSEIKNLKRHIEQAKQSPHMYKMLDAATAVILLDSVPYGTIDGIMDDDLLKELGL